jgi:selenocysteine-specific elongation factor
MRTALNVAGVDQDELERGNEVAAPGLLVPTRRLDLKVKLDVGPVAHRTRVRFNKGTAEALGRLLLLDGDHAQAGEARYAQLVLEQPTTAIRYEPFVLRDPSTLRLIGGGKILDPFPSPHRRQPWVVEELAKLEAAEGNPAALLRALFTRTRGRRRSYRAPELACVLTTVGEGEVDHLFDDLLASGIAVRFGAEYVPAAEVAALEKAVRAGIESALARDPLRESVSRDEIRARLPYILSPEGCGALLERMAAEGKLEAYRGGYRLAGEERAIAPEHQETLAALEAFMNAGPPMRGREEVEQHLAAYADGATILKYALARGALVMLPEKVVAKPGFVDTMEEELKAYLAQHESVRAAEYKDLYNLSRKQATALLDYFYERGVTVREGGTHRLAPRYAKKE